MLASSIMVNGIAYSGVVQIVSNLMFHFLLKAYCIKSE